MQIIKQSSCISGNIWKYSSYLHRNVKCILNGTRKQIIIAFKLNFHVYKKQTYFSLTWLREMFRNIPKSYRSIFVGNKNIFARYGSVDSNVCFAALLPPIRIKSCRQSYQTLTVKVSFEEPRTRILFSKFMKLLSIS